MTNNLQANKVRKQRVLYADRGRAVLPPGWRSTKMSDELNKLLEMARKVEMTPEQAEDQRRSFAYGNTKIENDSITWDRINRAAETLKKE